MVLATQPRHKVCAACPQTSHSSPSIGEYDVQHVIVDQSAIFVRVEVSGRTMVVRIPKGGGAAKVLDTGNVETPSILMADTSLYVWTNSGELCCGHDLHQLVVVMRESFGQRFVELVEGPDPAIQRTADLGVLREGAAEVATIPRMEVRYANSLAG
jgi:hypothetical protein